MPPNPLSSSSPPSNATNPAISAALQGATLAFQNRQRPTSWAPISTSPITVVAPNASVTPVPVKPIAGQKLAQKPKPAGVAGTTPGAAVERTGSGKKNALDGSALLAATQAVHTSSASQSVALPTRPNSCAGWSALATGDVGPHVPERSSDVVKAQDGSDSVRSPGASVSRISGPDGVKQSALLAATLAVSRSPSPVRATSPQPSVPSSITAAFSTRGQDGDSVASTMGAMDAAVGDCIADRTALDTTSILPTTTLVSLFEVKQNSTLPANISQSPSTDTRNSTKLKLVNTPRIPPPVPRTSRTSTMLPEEVGCQAKVTSEDNFPHAFNLAVGDSEDGPNENILDLDASLSPPMAAARLNDSQRPAAGVVQNPPYLVSSPTQAVPEQAQEPSAERVPRPARLETRELISKARPTQLFPASTGGPFRQTLHTIDHHHLPLRPQRTADSLRAETTGGSRSPNRQQLQRTGLLPTLRRPECSDSSDEDSRLRRARDRLTRSNRRHAHHEGSRRRWQDEITPEQRRRYEAVWASNRGYFLRKGWAFQHIDNIPPDLVARVLAQEEDDEDTAQNGAPHTRLWGANRVTAREEAITQAQIEASRAPEGTLESQMVANVVVRELWNRSQLPREELAEVWDLVDRSRSGALARDEFVVGMWLIDQRLRGRKIPARVSDSVWDSARRL
ncbi:putative rDNA silencing protein [Thermochaetoides thermophila DSM 1495]|uniref:Putative rDNA silencing protein n=1 Tax=Chaetomium thermophilum (strain DSM 1495 / CBS 144.50 / IMI 039719) TaxID=759272 RepID=G0S6T9_CHATD|nr:putative rDNA silencing protein [Thermochaetoides thermophila DSM 1495]EGS20847.1 putative rDNA silencing protein [Thermochaetoides thermophila DSM 1495]